METRAYRSRSTRTTRHTRDGKPIHSRPHDRDTEILHLLSYPAKLREPWTYEYLPTDYIAPLVGRGAYGLPKRLRALFDEPLCLLDRPGPIILYRQLIWSLGDNGVKTLREEGIELPPRKPRKIPHALMADMCAASFELAAKQFNLPISVVPAKTNLFRPDIPPFTFNGKIILFEADTGSEQIPKNKTNSDITSIEEKLHQYLSYIDSKDRRDILVLFMTAGPYRNTRVKAMVEMVKKVIDDLRIPRGYAAQIGFSSIDYTRYLDKLPKAGPWVVAQEYQRAGFPPLSLVQS
jgi:hypothetical protein